MACDLIQPKIRPFLDDLLDEKDYHLIHSHLEVCGPCRSYASSVGTLSYRIYELGQGPLPPDMVSAILYEAQKPSASPPENAPAPMPALGLFISKKDLLWFLAVVLLVLTAVSLAVMVIFQKKEEKAVGISAPAVPEPAPADTAEPVSAPTE